MARPRSETPKGRRNITMDEAAWIKGKKLAKEEQRSLSSFLSILVIREWDNKRRDTKARNQEAA